MLITLYRSLFADLLGSLHVVKSRVIILSGVRWCRCRETVWSGKETIAVHVHCCADVMLTYGVLMYISLCLHIYLSLPFYLRPDIYSVCFLGKKITIVRHAHFYADVVLVLVLWCV